MKFQFRDCIIAIPILIVVASASVVYHYEERNRSCQLLVDAYEKAGVVQKEALAQLLEEWVYNNSKKISRQTTQEIVAVIMQTEYPMLITAIMAAESEFVPSAGPTHAGAIGLGQIVPRHHATTLIKAGIIKETRDLFNIREGVLATEFIFKQILKEANGDVYLALDRYSGRSDGYPKKVVSTYLKLIMLKPIPKVVIKNG